MVQGVFTLNWVPTNPAGKCQKGTCFRVIHMAIVTGLLIIDYVRYEDFNDYQERTDPHCQQSPRQITETPHRWKQSLLSQTETNRQ